MSITIIRNSFIFLWTYHDTNTIQLTTPVKVRYRSIVVCQANGHYPTVLCLKRCILALAVMTCSPNSLSYISNKSFWLCR